MLLDACVGSDDCLYLNVYTKSLENNVKLPVLFWIHGGAFSLGSGNDDIYGPKYLLRKDVVLVTINYRLGALGKQFSGIYCENIYLILKCSKDISLFYFVLIQ